MGVSFVIVTFNSLATIGECLASVLDQDLDSFDVIVVDNDSTDGTVSFIESTFDRVTIIRNLRNLGFGVAANIGASRGLEEIIAMINPDVRLHRNWSAELLRYLGSSSQVGAAEGKLLLWREPGLLNVRESRTNVLGFGCMVGFRERDTHETAVREVAYPSGAAFMIKRTAFNQIHGFDEDFFLYHDDVDLGMRLYAAGWSVLNIPMAIAYHDFKPSLEPQKIYFLERNRWNSLAKNLPVGYFVRSGPLHLLAEAGLVTYLGRTCLLPAKIQAVIDFIRGIPGLLEKRRSCQKLVVDRAWWAGILGADFPTHLPRRGLAARTAGRVVENYHRAFFTGLAARLGASDGRGRR